MILVIPGHKQNRNRVATNHPGAYEKGSGEYIQRVRVNTEKAIIGPAAGLRAKSIISPAMFTYENPYLA